jgi:hypothetical protein
MGSLYIDKTSRHVKKSMLDRIIKKSLNRLEKDRKKGLITNLTIEINNDYIKAVYDGKTSPRHCKVGDSKTVL